MIDEFNLVSTMTLKRRIIKQMDVNSYIYTKLFPVFQDFKNNIDNRQNFCSLRDYLNTQRYDIPLVQQFYILKYYLAYLFEYKQLYDDILKLIGEKKEINILSIGCGCGLDLSGIILSLHDRNQLKNISLSYTGIDLANWEYRSLICCNTKYRKTNFILSNIRNVNFNIISTKFDIIIFPKSIGDLVYKYEDFLGLVSVFRNIRTNENDVIIACSHRSPREDPDDWCISFKIDFKRFEWFVKKIKNINSFKNDKNSGIIEMGDNFISDIDRRFVYPSEISSYMDSFDILCKGKNLGKNECISCRDQIRPFPLLKTYRVSYQYSYLDK